MKPGWLELEAGQGRFADETAREATEELNGLFELFQDDDVLQLFGMREPARRCSGGSVPGERAARRRRSASRGLVSTVWLDDTYRLPQRTFGHGRAAVGLTVVREGEDKALNLVEEVDLAGGISV